MNDTQRKDRAYSGSLFTDPDNWLHGVMPHSALDAICLELAVREALEHGHGQSGVYVVRLHAELAVVSNYDCLLVLGSPKKLKELIAKVRSRKKYYLADPRADFMRKWLSEPPTDA